MARLSSVLTVNISTGSDDSWLEEAVPQIDRNGLAIGALQRVRKLEHGSMIIEAGNSKYKVH